MASFGEQQFTRIGELDTLAQSGTTQKSKLQVRVYGTGANVKSEKARKITRKKIITIKLVLALIDVANQKQAFERVKSYWNTYHCLSSVYYSDERLHGKFCKNRFCVVCTNNRKAEIINKYLPIVSKWDRPAHTILTIQAVKKEQIKTRMDEMQKVLGRLLGRIKKRHQRGLIKKFKCIHSLECNFNPVERTYNPHYHIISNDPKIAANIMKEWREIWGGQLASSAAQKTYSIRNKEVALKEVVKYVTKIFTPPDGAKSYKKISPKVYISAMDNIIAATRKRRIFERSGFNLPKGVEVSYPSKLIKGYSNLEFVIGEMNWVENESGLCLTDYELPRELEALLAEMDLTTE